jgi:ribosomal protein S27E
MQKVGKLKTLKVKCCNCENKFIATPDDFIMTQHETRRVLEPMLRCPYCKTYLYKSYGVFGGTIWEEPFWWFKIVEENEQK